MRLISRWVNVRGELFSSTFTYGMTALVKLVSSLVLTRLLNPQAYGIFSILFSILFMIELMSDVGTVGLLVRHPRGGDKRFVHTVWTVRLMRGCINFGLLYALAPVIAGIYETPVLTGALRTFSFWFLLTGMESMGFVLAQRNQRSRIGNYAELLTSIVMTAAIIGLATVLRNQYALIYGALLQRALMMIASHFFYRDIGVGIAFDREAVADQFQFARVVLPSSLLTIVLSQYDKLVLLKLFDLSLLGVYGVAGGMVGPIAGLVMHNSRVVLYARCASYFRANRATAAFRYYSENKRLLSIGTLLPAMLAGFAQPIVSFLYDSRYAGAGTMLMALSLGALSASFQNASENLLVASGRTHVVLIANVVRLFTIVPATLLGYYFFGFDGFLWCSVAASVAVLFYFFREQRRHGLLDLRAELVRAGWGLGVFALCLAVSKLLMPYVPLDFVHHFLKKH